MRKLLTLWIALLAAIVGGSLQQAQAQMTVYSPLSITGNDNGNGGYSFRSKRITVASNLGQVRVKISTDTAIGTLNVNNVSIGKWAGTNADTTTTPEELLFSGGHGFNITTTPNGTATSDWLTPAGFTWSSGDTLVVIVDMGATADTGTGAFVSGNDTYYHSPAASYNVAAPAGYTQFNRKRAGRTDRDEGGWSRRWTSGVALVDGRRELRFVR
jgi:hypothetical protein